VGRGHLLLRRGRLGQPGPRTPADSVHRGDPVVVEGRLDQRSWENNQGEKRSKIETTANEVAPSLRWATVEVSKNHRSTPQTVPAGDGSEKAGAAQTASAPDLLAGMQEVYVQ